VTGGLAAFHLRRFLSAVPTLVGITLVTFFLLEALPGRDLALAGHREGSLAGAEEIRRLREVYRLDEPAWRRYLDWAVGLARWDPGKSLLDGRSVRDLIREAALPTLALNLTAFLLAFGISVPLGVAWARRRGSAADRFGAAGVFLLYAFPSFAAALLLQQLFALRLGWLPLQGLPDLPPGGAGFGGLAGSIRHLVLPAVCLSYGAIAYLARFTRASLLEAIGQEWLLAARARGVRESVLAWRHALRNAAAPLLTLVGFLVPSLLAGSVLIETIFSWPGIGRLYVHALQNRDHAVVLGLTALTAVLTLAGSLLADLLVSIADPRIRPGAAR
jgi:peptide/nickel transport system permease protein